MEVIVVIGVIKGIRVIRIVNICVLRHLPPKQRGHRPQDFYVFTPKSVNICLVISA